MNRNRLHVNAGEVDGSTSPKRTSAQPTSHTMPPSFLAPDVLKHLCRELDRDKVETEFSTKVNRADLNSTDDRFSLRTVRSFQRRIALEEALRVKGDTYTTLHGSRQTSANPPAENAPRIFSRQTARFELLDSRSLRGICSIIIIMSYNIRMCIDTLNCKLFKLL